MSSLRARWSRFPRPVPPTFDPQQRVNFFLMAPPIINYIDIIAGTLSHIRVGAAVRSAVAKTTRRTVSFTRKRARWKASLLIAQPPLRPQPRPRPSRPHPSLQPPPIPSLIRSNLTYTRRQLTLWHMTFGNLRPALLACAFLSLPNGTP